MDKQYPKITVGCFIINDRKEILLVKSYKWPGKWVVMGGHIELGESVAQTAVREAKEEVGLDVEFVRVIEAVEFVFDPNFHDKKHFIGLQCECKLINNQDLSIDNDEIQEARWFPLTEAVKMVGVLPVTQDTIRMILAKK